MSLITKLFSYVLLTTSKYGIDESHGLTHSMSVLHYAHALYQSELINKPIIQPQERIIYISAIIHDMCDKKYMNEKDGIYEIEHFLHEKISDVEIDVIKQIISTMSYSTVQKQGFPHMGAFQHSYHIVREADLLAAYDFDRSMVYHMNRCTNGNIHDAFTNANELFKNRVFKHEENGLLLLDYSKHASIELQQTALNRMQVWKKIFTSRTFM